MLSVDPTRSEVLHCTKIITDNMTSHTPELVVGEFSAYIYGSKGCQVTAPPTIIVKYFNLLQWRNSPFTHKLFDSSCLFVTARKG